MKKLIFSLLAISVLMTSCDDGWGIFDGGNRITGKGAVERTTRDVKDFKSIDLATSANVFVKQGTAFKVEVEAQKNIAEVFETVVEDGVLKLKTKKGIWNLTYEKLNVYVEMPTVETLEISGSGDMMVETALSGDKMRLHISGSGNILAEKGVIVKALEIGLSGSGDVKASGISASELSTEITGSGGLELTGTADKANYSISGSGDISAKNVKSKTVEAHISGSGSISCHADESLDAHASGSGDITYSGNATSVKSKASGSGSVTKE
jgi:Putative auto-transporter adhesin, head GIN domain